MLDELVSDYLEASGFVKSDSESDVSFVELFGNFRQFCAFRGQSCPSEAGFTLTVMRVSGKIGYPVLRVVRSGLVRCSGVLIVPRSDAISNDVLDFLKDKDWCKLHSYPSRHCENFTLRSDFYRAYREWCRGRDVRPDGKFGCYEKLRGSKHVYFGTTQGGHDVLRGVTLLRTTAPEPVTADDDL